MHGLLRGFHRLMHFPHARSQCLFLHELTLCPTTQAEALKNTNPDIHALFSLGILFQFSDESIHLLLSLLPVST